MLRHQGGTWAAVLLAAMMALLLSACRTEEVPNDRPVETGAATPATGEIEELAEAPEAYFGREVTVDGQIGRVFGPRAFMLGGRAAFGGGEVLVVTARPVPLLPNRTPEAPWVERDPVRVTGLVRQMTAAEIEDELGFDLAEGAGSGEEPVLVAEAVEAAE